MAAYAALVSLMNLIDQIHHHPQPPITLDKEQTQTLTENIAFLQDFLEAYNSHYSKQEMQRLRIRIADAAYAAEDVIESHIADQILARRNKTSSADLYQSQQRAAGNVIVESKITHDDANKIWCAGAHLYQDLQKVQEEMDLVKKDVEEIKDELGTQEQLQRTTTVSSRSRSTQHNIMVVSEDVLNKLLHKLTGQPHSDRQIIPISGMGGIGKTTLAKTLYTNPLIEHYFHVLAWVTISREYNMKEILVEVLFCLKDQGSKESLSLMNMAQLGEKLYKSLYGRRYLIVMDDMWSYDVWDKVKFYFPRNNDGSRIIVTTRLSNVASYLSGGCTHEMDFLDQDQSWSLFFKIVFGEDNCPPELEDIGMEIARNCKGLPLSIVVLGGLLAKSKPTREYWAYILRNVSSIVNLEESERCFKILHTSYDELPAHLKACFLYIGIFREDSQIHVSSLINMWVAEGFLKPISGKSLEESGEEYLMDLIDRNLILVSQRGYFEKVVYCIIHDLLGDLCVREARKEKFFFRIKLHDHEVINTPRRIVIDDNISKLEYLHALQSASAVRSLICKFVGGLSSVELRLLRILQWMGEPDPRNRLEDSLSHINLRYAAVDGYKYPIFSSSVLSLLWNLQILIAYGGHGPIAPFEIWKMPLIRHVQCLFLIVPDPPSDHTDEFVLLNLHTLSQVVNLKFGEEAVKRIPNVKKLGLLYTEASDYCLNNLVRLYKLECLHCEFQVGGDFGQNCIFPHSLKELSLKFAKFSWEDINTKIGSLPHLQALTLSLVMPFTTTKWETIQGQFCSLKYLHISGCRKWEYWSTESSHFPCLEHLVLDGLKQLKEIPCCIGDIPTLKSIQLRNCGYSIIISAKQIAEEQEEFGNETLRVTVIIYKSELEQGDYERAKSLASHNFQLEFF